ncbi:MAG: BREX system ATP-binding domain-containing protein [Dehalococcoidia bacterium]
MKPQAWVEFVGQEYLDSFVRDGGATIKFAVSMDGSVRPQVLDGLTGRATELGYLSVSVSAADTKVHMIDKLFFRIAEQIPWQRLSEQIIVNLAKEERYAPPSDGDDPLLARLAHANGTDPDFLRNVLREQIATKVFRPRTLAKDFRIAMTRLCLAQLTGGEEGETTAGVLTDWLTGRNTSIGAVKPYQIFSRINRANARHYFESLLRWVRLAGYTGTLVVVDISRVTVAKNPKDEQLYYSKAAVLDTYEVLRELIDGTDRLEGCLVVVLPEVAFLDEDTYGRGIGAYEALKLRIFDEIRDRQIVNPMASLVRLSSVAGAVQ